MSDENQIDESVVIPEVDPEVAALDEKLAAAHQGEISDSDKEALNAMIDERNEAYKRLHPAPQAPEATEA